MPIPRSLRPTRSRHGLPPKVVSAMLHRQGGLCGICLAPLGPTYSIDHDHEQARLDGHDEHVGCRNCVRGLVCAACNSMLGFARDDPRTLRAGARWVEAFKALRGTP